MTHAGNDSFSFCGSNSTMQRRRYSSYRTLNKQFTSISSIHRVAVGFETDGVRSTGAGDLLTTPAGRPARSREYAPCLTYPLGLSHFATCVNSSMSRLGSTRTVIYCCRYLHSPASGVTQIGLPLRNGKGDATIYAIAERTLTRSITTLQMKCYVLWKGRSLG